MNQEPKRYDELLRRRKVVVAATSAIAGVILSSNVELLSYYLSIEPVALSILAIFLIALAAAFILLLYLRGEIGGNQAVNGFPEPYRKQKSSSIQDDLRNRIESLSKAIENIKISKISIEEGERAAILEGLLSSLNDDLINELESRFAKSILTESRLRSAKDLYQESTRRLSEEIEKLGRRANLNLVIGVLTTSIAVALLVYMVLGNDAKINNVTELLSYYIPRISVAVFIEIFSFFFLKLYKSNLDEIKHYQNEIIRISQQRVAFETSVATDDATVISSFISKSLQGNSEISMSSDVQTAAGQIEQLSKVVEQTSKIITNLTKQGQSSS